MDCIFTDEPAVVPPYRVGVVTDVNTPVEGLDEPIEEFVIVSPATLDVKLGAPAPPDVSNWPDVPAAVVTRVVVDAP